MTKETSIGRGMLRIETWVPCRRPGKPKDPNVKPVNIKKIVNPVCAQNASVQNGSACKVPPTPPSTNNGPVRLIAKYNYQANTNQPGGFEEMSLAAGEKLQFVAPHIVNPYWWQATKENGQSAFVPASYVLVLEEKKLTSLPWLEEKKAEKERQEKERAEVENSGFGQPSQPAFKPYQSAYSKTDTPKAEPSNYYCEVCDKTLNGIKPYQAHMVSKAHKEEVRLAQLYST